MKLLVVGAGGHAKVVVDAARACGLEVVGAVDEADGVASVLGVPVHADATHLEADGFIVAVGDNASRGRLFAEYSERGMTPLTVVHPTATIAPGVVFGAGVFVAAGVVVNPDARIGDDCILNTGCTVDHDCVIGEHAHVGPGVNLCGGVTVGAGSLLGVGACAIPGATIGAEAVIGAGAVVVGIVPDGVTAVGVPAHQLGADREA